MSHFTSASVILSFPSAGCNFLGNWQREAKVSRGGPGQRESFKGRHSGTWNDGACLLLCPNLLVNTPLVRQHSLSLAALCHSLLPRNFAPLVDRRRRASAEHKRKDRSAWWVWISGCRDGGTSSRHLAFSCFFQVRTFPIASSGRIFWNSVNSVGHQKKNLFSLAGEWPNKLFIRKINVEKQGLYDDGVPLFLANFPEGLLCPMPRRPLMVRAALLRRSCDGVAAATELRRPAPSRAFCATR